MKLTKVFVIFLFIFALVGTISTHNFSEDFNTLDRSFSFFSNEEALEEPSPVVSPTPPVLSRGYKKGRRGLAILALLNKNFPVADAYDVLKESDRPAFSFLYGKYAFGADPRNYYDLMSRFIEDGKRVHVEIYTLCGACRPPRISGMNLASFARKKSVNSLEKAFLNNKKFSRKYRNWVNNIKETFVDPYPEMSFTITISLEDNYEDRWKVVGKQVKQLRKVFKGYKNVQLARNPVGSIPYGFGNLKREIHTVSERDLNLLNRGDIISFDGDYFNYPGEDVRNSPGYRRNNRLGKPVPSFDQIKSLVRAARKKKIDIYVWRFEFQGLDTDKRIHPRKRSYRIVGKKYLKQLMRL